MGESTIDSSEVSIAMLKREKQDALYALDEKEIELAKANDQLLDPKHPVSSGVFNFRRNCIHRSAWGSSRCCVSQYSGPDWLGTAEPMIVEASMILSSWPRLINSVHQS